MSSENRKPFETATVLNQALLDASQDNLTNGLEPIVEIEAPDGSIIRASDRNKYVGEHFYEALTNFPAVTRTLGEWLSSGVEFGEVEFELSNVDGRYNRFLPGGANFAGWVGRTVTVKIGLREVQSTYRTIFRGRITREAGFGRTVKSVIVRARDELERVSKTFPTEVFSDTAFPKADQEVWGTLKPVIYGDWTVDVTAGSASVPAVVVNGASIFVNGEELAVQVAAGTPAVFTYVNHRLVAGDLVNVSGDALPAGITPGDFTVSASGLTFDDFTLTGVNASAAGEATIKKPDLSARENVQLVICGPAIEAFFASHVYILRSEKKHRVPFAQIDAVGVGNNTFELIQNQPGFQIDGENWVYDKSDEIFVRVKGKSLTVYDNNAVAIARDIMEVYGGVAVGEFDDNWDTYKFKTSPPQSAILNISARAYIREPQEVLVYVKSLLAQVRLEMFVDRNLQFRLHANHFEDWEEASNFIVRNWDCEKESFTPKIDDRNNFTRARAAYNFLPDVGENAYTTDYYRNDAAIAQAGTAITQAVLYPNLHDGAQVALQLQETLKLASAYREIISVGLTPRSFLQDVGGYVRVQVSIGSTVLDGVPCLIRELSYDPGSLKISAKLWSFAMVPFPGWTPGYAGTVGGSTAGITKE